MEVDRKGVSSSGMEGEYYEGGEMRYDAVFS